MNDADKATTKIAFYAYVLWAMALAGCSGAKPPPPPGPPEVGVLTLRSEPVTLTTSLPGRTVAFRIAEVRPQVSGVILKRLFVEGSDVKSGQQLYQIDPAPFRANLQSAQASLARAQATLASSKLLAQRYKPLSEAHAVSQQALDNAVAAELQAVADVTSAKASVDTAKINLIYTRVLSPIAGRTGRSSVTEGALVGANQNAALVVVQQRDPMYVDVNQPSTVLLRLERSLAVGGLQKSANGGAQTKLTLEDNTAFAESGQLQFSEVAVDSGTGTVTLRAVFPNPNQILRPGMFVHELVEEGVEEHGLLLPQQAVSRNQAGQPTTLVVGKDNKLELRTIKTERAIGDKWLVTDGVSPGDRVIVIGQVRIMPGVTQVKPHEVTAEELKAVPSDPTGPKH